MEKVRIVEVAPRDGLQSIPLNIPTKRKVELINRLSSTGLQEIEVTSFVSPKWVPQLSDAPEVSRLIKKNPLVRYTALVPNKVGLNKAIESGYKSVAFITTCSETFSQKNTNCTISESLETIASLRSLWSQYNMHVRVYISTVWYCPFEGKMNPDPLMNVVQKLIDLNIDEISLADTIGKAKKGDVEETLEIILKYWDPSKFALHFHDTYKNAKQNIISGINLGFRNFDSSVGGIGGCPYAPGSSGNVATESVLEICENNGFDTGINKQSLSDAGKYISDILHKGEKTNG